MPLVLKQLKDKHDKGYTHNQATRERAASDAVFYWVTHWGESGFNDIHLTYKGQFDVLRKAGRDILGDLEANPVSIDFSPEDETSDDSADLADRYYRAGTSQNISIEAFSNAKADIVVCGFGAWELYTEYATNRAGNTNQVIKRRPIYEANNKVFWEPNAKLKDKSDATWCSYLTAYSEQGYIDLKEAMTGEELDHVDADSFKSPEHSYAFPWILGEDKKIFVTSFFHVEEIEDKILIMVDPFGETSEVRESDLEDIMDELIDTGHTIESERVITRNQVTKYIASGLEILNGDVDPETGERMGEVISGEYIPIIPVYGERAFVEDQEHYEGITNLAKDPQILRDFQLSYLADIVSKSPRQKPIFWQEQIANFEDYYSLSGSENNYAYLLQNRKGVDGLDLPIGPIAVMPETPIPTALIQSIALSREAVTDVAPSGAPGDVADIDLTGKALQILNAKIEKQSIVYQGNYKHALRHDGVVWASIASEIIDSPRKVRVELPDGTRKEVQVMEQIFDEETGELVTINDLRNTQFEITSKIGPSYSTLKEQTVDRISLMIAQMDPTDPIRKALQLKQIVLTDGADFNDIKEFANKQLVLQGFREPETDEEKALLEAAQNQPKEPDAMMVAAQAADKEGEAALLEQKRKGIEMQLTAQNNQAKTQIEGFKAETGRMDTQIDAQEAGAKINTGKIDNFGKKLDNTKKMIDIKDLSDKQLFQRMVANG